MSESKVGPEPAYHVPAPSLQRASRKSTRRVSSGMSVKQRALINESSDPTIVTCIPPQEGPVLPGALHGGDGQSCKVQQPAEVLMQLE